MCSEREPPRVLLVALLGLVLTCAGCGKKGNPLPPPRPIPAPTSDLALHQKGNELLLRMSYPRTTVSGAPLSAIAEVQVWQMVLAAPPGDPGRPDPAAFKAAAQPRMSLTGPELASAIEGDLIVARLPLTGEADGSQLMILGIKTVSPSGEVSAFSNLVQLLPRAAIAAPASFELAPGGQGIEVRWAAVEGSEAYRIYRRLASARVFADPLVELGAARNHYLDEAAVFGQRYIYTVSAIASRVPLVESAPGLEREIDYQDVFPPAAPSELVALPDAGRVRLVWPRSVDNDVVGYHVYRRDPRAEEARRLTRQPVSELEWVDSGLASGLTYGYAVQAVDLRGNEGPLSEEVRATSR